ncbi:MAG: hypothetical protein N4A45_10425 [Flavobacteriales bacterium]|jgi:hypothetical protein|nr:hypothetical protein [Flavobacteriales bacterium]
MTLQEAKEKGLYIHTYDLNRFKYRDENDVEHLIHNGKEVAKGLYVYSYDENRWEYRDEKGIWHEVDLTKD